MYETSMRAYTSAMVRSVVTLEEFINLPRSLSAETNMAVYGYGKRGEDPQMIMEKRSAAWSLDCVVGTDSVEVEWTPIKTSSQDSWPRISPRAVKAPGSTE